jgi:hypothetical protein
MEESVTNYPNLKLLLSFHLTPAMDTCGGWGLSGWGQIKLALSVIFAILEAGNLGFRHCYVCSVAYCTTYIENLGSVL